MKSRIRVGAAVSIGLLPLLPLAVRSPVTAMEPEASARLLISPERARVEAASPIVLDISVRDMGRDEVVYGTSDSEWDFKFTVTRDGAAVPLTAYGAASAAAWKKRTVFYQLMRIVVKPGGEEESRLLLNQLYDMSIPGAYRIRASRAVSIVRGELSHANQGTQVLLESDPITVHVRAFDASMPPPMKGKAAPGR